MDALPNLKVSVIQPYLTILDHVRESGLVERFEADISTRLSDLTTRIQDVSVQYYQEKMRSLQASPGVNRALPLLLMTDELEKVAKQLDKRFPDPLVGYDLARILTSGDTDIMCLEGWIWFLLWWKPRFHCLSANFKTPRGDCMNRR